MRRLPFQRSLRPVRCLPATDLLPSTVSGCTATILSAGALLLAAVTTGLAHAEAAAAPTAQAAPVAPAAPAALPPGSPLIGQPDSEGARRLAPVAMPPIPASEDRLPLTALKLPPGFHIEVFKAKVPNARELAVSERGTVFVGSRLLDKVHAIVTRDGKRELKVVASGLHRPNGVAVHKGTLYIAEVSRVSRIEHVEDVLDHPPAPTVIYDDLPKDEAHGWKFIAVGPDEKLYVPVGQPCNNCLPPSTHGQIRRMNLDGTQAEVIARGVRNTVGFDWNPKGGQFYFTDNGRDWLSEDVPEDELNRLSHVGEHFGAPYCYQGNVADSEFGWGHSCSEFTPPVGLMGIHAAALGMRFVRGTQFPEAYRDAIFVARHGSWNRSVKVGGDVVAVHLKPDGTVRSVEPFLTGFLSDNHYLGRPVDVEFLPDGSMLVSDDYNGAIYRITYAAPAMAAR